MHRGASPHRVPNASLWSFNLHPSIVPSPTPRCRIPARICTTSCAHRVYTLPERATRRHSTHNIRRVLGRLQAGNGLHFRGRDEFVIWNWSHCGPYCFAHSSLVPPPAPATCPNQGFSRPGSISATQHGRINCYRTIARSVRTCNHVAKSCVPRPRRACKQRGLFSVFLSESFTQTLSLRFSRTVCRAADAGACTTTIPIQISVGRRVLRVSTIR